MNFQITLNIFSDTIELGKQTPDGWRDLVSADFAHPFYLCAHCIKCLFPNNSFLYNYFAILMNEWARIFKQQNALHNHKDLVKSCKNRKFLGLVHVDNFLTNGRRAGYMTLT